MCSWLSMAMLVISVLPSSCMGASQGKKQKYQHGKDIIVSVRFMPDGRRFVSASNDGTIVMWDVEMGRQVWQVDLDAGTKTNESHTLSNVSDMDLSPDGNTLAVAYDRVRVVDNQLAGKREYRIGLLDASNGREQRAFTGHTALIGTMAFSGDGRLLASTSADRTLRLWDTETGKQLWSIGLEEAGHAVAISNDTKHIAIATQAVNNPGEPIVAVYDAESGHLERKFQQGKRNVSRLAFAPKRPLLAVASDDLSGAQIDIWELSAKEAKRTFTDHEAGITAIAFSADGRLLASGDLRRGRGNVVVRDLTRNVPLRKHKLSSGVSSLSFSPDSSILAVGTYKGQIVLLTP